MNPTEDEEPIGIIAALLERFHRDHDQGGLATLETYLVDFPGYEDLVRREYWAFAEERSASPTPTPEGPEAQSPWMPEGSQIGPYVLKTLIARGGQGVVYRARDTRLPRDVALKLLIGRHFTTQEDRIRFLREAEIAARIDHPLVAAVIDSGEHEGLPWIAMRFVSGPSLAAQMAESRGDSERESQTSDLNRCLDLLIQLTGAVAAAHAEGVVHRDIKPGNVLIREDGAPVLVDFGLAKLGGTEREALTQTGSVFGTTAYMAPEQLRGEDATASADVHALGVLGFELLTGVHPYAGPTRELIAQRILDEDPENLKRLRPQLSNDLCAVLETALAKDPAARYADAKALLRDLEAARAGRPVSVKRTSSFGRLRRFAKRRPALFALSLTSIVALLGIAGLGGFLAASWQTIATGEAQLLYEAREAKLAEAFLQLGEGSRVEARRLFQEMLGDEAIAIEALFGLALASLFDHDNTTAEKLLASHPRGNDPRLAPLHRFLAGEKEEGGAQASSEAIQSEDDAPKDALQLFIEGHLLVVRGHQGEKRAFERAYALLTEAALRSPTPRAIIVFERSHAASHLPQRARALAAAETCVQMWPESPSAHYWLAFALKESDPLRAIRSMEVTLKEIPRHPAWHDLGNLLRKVGRIEEAKLAYTKAVHLFPEIAMMHSSLGSLDESLGNEEAAQLGYEKALQVDASYAPAAVNLAALHHRRRNFESAQELIDKAVKLAPNDPIAWFNRSVIMQSLNQNEAALESIQRALELQEQDAKFWSEAASIFRDLSKADDELRARRRAVELAPEDAHLRCFLAEALMRGKRIGEAEREMASVPEPERQNSSAQSVLGEIAYAQKRHDDALAHFQKARELDPTSARIAIRLATQFLQAYRAREAKECLDAALALDPEDPAVKQTTKLIAPAIEKLLPLEDFLESVLRGEAPTQASADEYQAAMAIAERQGRKEDTCTVLDHWIRSGLAIPDHCFRSGASRAMECSEILIDGSASRPEEEQRRYRELSRGWLQKALDGLSGPGSAGKKGWQPLLTSAAWVRLKERVAELPEEERVAWQALIAEIEAKVR